MGANPLLVEVTRGPAVESVHRGRAAVVDVRGTVQARWGDIESAVYPRSAIKALQALHLVESGAADAFACTDAELAIACASHTGTAAHVAVVRGWLARMGIAEDALACGPQWPGDDDALVALAAAGHAPGAVHNNCSGKHTGMLATARHLGEPLAGYVRPDHPVQQRILGTLEAMTGADLGQAARGIDGCSVPTWAVPLAGLAFAFARIAAPENLPDRRAAAVLRLRAAVAAYPEMVAGPGRYATRLMQALGPRLFVKSGAEGVMCAALPEYGLGIAVKADDGAARAAQMMMTAMLQRVGVLDGTDAVADLLHPRLTNRAGLAVGEIRPADALAF